MEMPRLTPLLTDCGLKYTHNPSTKPWKTLQVSHSRLENPSAKTM